MLFDLNKYTELYLNWGLVFSLIGLALVAWLVYSLIKGIKTGVWKGSKSQYGDSAPIYKREDEPKMFWFCVVFNSTVAFGILFGIFYWIFIGAGVLKANHELFNAVRQVDIEAIEQAIADGANINAMSSGLAPLHLAAIQGQNRISELLIAKGADVNAWSDDGFTPLDGAIMGGTTETAALLRKHGGKTGEELKAEGK